MRTEDTEVIVPIKGDRAARLRAIAPVDGGRVAGEAEVTVWIGEDRHFLIAEVGVASDAEGAALRVQGQETSLDKLRHEYVGDRRTQAADQVVALPGPKRGGT